MLYYALMKKGSSMKLYLALALGLLSSQSFAQQRQGNAAEQMGYASIGTAFRIVTDTAVSFAATSVSSTFTSDTIPKTYRLVASTAAHVNISNPSTTAPTATASNTLLPANTPEYFVIPPKTNMAVIQDSTAGVLYIGKTGN